MKDKTIAAILAFFGGIVGLHRFYLGQQGLGFLHIVIFALAMAAGPTVFFVLALSLAMIFGIIDAISFLSMDQREFDSKYNHKVNQKSEQSLTNSPSKQRPMTDRERRFQQRQRERAERERERIRRAKERNNQRTESPSPRARSGAGNAEREAGVRYFKDFDYPAAIKAFKKALEKNPRDIASHFNIACAYSAEEEADLALYHLDRAVALGFEDFARIRNHDSLAYLRIQDSYLDFERNNFRLTAVVPPPEPAVEEEKQEPPISDDLLDQLQRLAALREKGLLTEKEFADQKRRLLG